MEWNNNMNTSSDLSQVSQLVESVTVPGESVGATPALGTDWTVGFKRLLDCLLHDDDVRCECCGDDKESAIP